MSVRFARRAMAGIAAWCAIGGFATAALFARTWVSPAFIASAILVGICGSLTAIGLLRDSAWAAGATLVLGFSGALFPALGVAAARNSTSDGFLAASIGGLMFLAFCASVAHALRRATRRAVSQVSAPPGTVI